MAVSDFAQTPLRILLLEDSRFDAEFVGEFVRVNYPRARMQVVDNEAGFSMALAVGLDGERFDLILSDYELPGYGGPQALDLARATVPQTPFIFVSGVIGEENVVDMLKRGATDYVSKNRLSRLPFVVDRALQEVAEREARDRAERELRAARDEADRARAVDDGALKTLVGELRKPLAAIGAALQTLESDTTLVARHIDLLLMIRRQVAVETLLIDNLFAKLLPRPSGQSAASAAADALPALPALRMLLVEDNEDAAYAMMLSFEYYGYEVTHAATLGQAFEAAGATRFDVIVTDLGLPDGDGIELATALSATVPLIALSGYGSAEDLRRTAAAGFADHLIKPADPQRVHDAVMRAIARAET